MGSSQLEESSAASASGPSSSSSGSLTVMPSSQFSSDSKAVSVRGLKLFSIDGAEMIWGGLH